MLGACGGNPRGHPGAPHRECQRRSGSQRVGSSQDATYKEKELAKETGSSRTSVRETSQVLQAEGPVELLPNRGATVRICRLDEIETSLIARLKEKR